jgi:hypothetical protein
MADNALIVTVKPTKTVVSSVTIAPTTSISLGSLTNVDTSGADDGEVLLFDAANSKFIVAEPSNLDSNNITSINGGQF